MIRLKTAGEIDAIAAAGAILAGFFEAIAAEVRPDVTTAALDRFGESYIRSHPGAEPAFKGLYGFPASLCISVNEEVVHGIPAASRRLREGDIVSIDAGVKLDGWFADRAMTYAVGSIDARAARLMDVTRQCLDAAIDQARSGRRLGDLGHAVQERAEAAGYEVVRELVGHGLGREPHEEPQVPNYGRAGRGLPLRPGLVIAIEPMVNEGTADIRTLGDRWTVVTADGSRSAHFEHTVAVTQNGPRILTAGASGAGSSNGGRNSGDGDVKRATGGGRREAGDVKRAT